MTNAAKKITALLRPIELKDGVKVAVGETYNDQHYMQLPTELRLDPSVPLRSSLRDSLRVFHGSVIDYLAEQKIDSIDKVTAFLASLGPAIITGSSNGTGWTDFSPHPLKPPNSADQTFASFNATVDAFFGALLEKREDERAKQQEVDACKKLDAIEREQQGRARSLEAQAEDCLKKAKAIEENIKLVEQALTVCRGAVDAGMDWKAFEQVIEAERRRGTSTAQAIHRLDLARQRVTLELASSRDNERPCLVEVDVDESPHGNASNYYGQRKALQDKLERTVRAHTSALRSAEAKIRHDLAASRRAQNRLVLMKRVRRRWWFERFAWFLSSEGFLVLAGRDAQQNEVLVKKYLRMRDVYVHADISGAGSIVIRNHHTANATSSNVIPPRTLAEAGTASLCQSRAWQAKIVTSAWWVRADQVSKTAPSGEYLSTGSFMVRGTKHFLPPMPMIYGLAFVFVVDDEMRARRKAKRIINDSHEADVDNEMAEKTHRYLSMIESRSASTGEQSEREGEDSGGDSSEEGEEEAENILTEYAECDLLLASPTPEEIPHLLYAIPMCAPYSSLTHYPFKCKLVPAGGVTVKKGKLVKTAVAVMLQNEHFTAGHQSTEEQVETVRELIKAVPEQDITQCIPADAKLAGSAVDIGRAKAQKKSEKKTAAKNAAADGAATSSKKTSSKKGKTKK